jgi:ubiquinone biosynthesis accessory factor UbiJ
MLHALSQSLTPAVMERITLMVNHVLGSEPVAQERLRLHAGKSLLVELAGWPGFLPSPPPLAWQITAAGLLEWHAAATPNEGSSLPAAPTDLRLRVHLADPATLLSRLLANQPPEVDIEGEAQLAADVGWLVQNLRWDLAADLERFLPMPVVQALSQLGRGVAQALRAALARWPGAARV